MLADRRSSGICFYRCRHHLRQHGFVYERRKVLRKVIILCDRCGAEIRNVPKRFSVKEVRDAAGESPTIVPVEGEMDSMDFCEGCFREVADFMTRRKTPGQDQAPTAKAGASPAKTQHEEKPGPAELYHDEIELYLSQKKPVKWIAEKLNRYGVGYSTALEAVEKVKAEIEEKLVRKIVKR